MQLSETPKQTNSLFNAMHRFLGAVNNMDQTVMVPSLLRDLPLDQDLEMSAGKTATAADLDEEQGDMYGYYQLLKSIRRDIEWGVRRAAATEDEDQDQDQDQEMRRRRRSRMGGKITRTNSMASLASMSSTSTSSSSSCSSEEEDEEDEDLQKQLQFHLTGLHGVLSKLTLQAHSLTNRYKQEVGIGGWGQ
ncbi:unnamed protein product [Merluccius merluccius]